MQTGLLNIKAGISNNNNNFYVLTNSVSYVSYRCSTLNSPKQRVVGTEFRTCRRWFSPASGLSWSS